MTSQQSSGTVERIKKFIYNMWSNLDIFLKKSVSCFVYVVLLISLEKMRKKFTSVSLSYKDVILFSNIFYVFDVVYVKSNRISFEFSGNAVKKAEGNLKLRKLKVDVLTVQRRGPRLSTFAIRPKFQT